MPNIPTIQIPSDANIVLSSTSKGDSMKWYLSQRNAFVKANRIENGREYQDSISEVIASRIAAHMHIPSIQYSLCYIDTGNDESPILGTLSQNFCNENEAYISFETMVESSYDKVSWGVSAQDNYQHTLRIFKELSGLDAQHYIDVMLLFDYIICNEDRHTNNFGIIYNAETETYRFPPLFDNGYSLGFMQYERKPVKQFLYSCKAKPFSTSFAKQLNLVKALPEGIILPNCFEETLFNHLPLTEAQKVYCLEVLNNRLHNIKEGFL